ncbi:MAG: DUF1761 domain-containing protein [Spirochaetales bacterium]|nr:DUF1761 domain-containing protein [Spirochaetales bacterium]
MLHFEVSVGPLLVVAALNFLLSWIWYSPLLFAKPWGEALGWGKGREMTEDDKKRMPGLFLSGLVSSLLLSYGLQVVVHSVGANDFLTGLAVGVVAWFTFALTHSLNTLWEGRKPIVLTINNGLFLLTYAVFGGAIAVWH